MPLERCYYPTQKEPCPNHSYCSFLKASACFSFFCKKLHYAERNPSDTKRWCPCYDVGPLSYDTHSHLFWMAFQFFLRSGLSQGQGQCMLTFGQALKDYFWRVWGQAQTCLENNPDDDWRLLSDSWKDQMAEGMCVEGGIWKQGREYFLSVVNNRRWAGNAQWTCS